VSQAAARKYIIRTRGQTLELPGVLAVMVGQAGELIINGENSERLAVFAAAEWLSVIMAEDDDA
jgi:hypothetical protein